jgi:YfiH family protein
MAESFLRPDWLPPSNIIAGVTTKGLTSKEQGAKEAQFATNNLALHVGDDERAVLANRAQLARDLGIPLENFYWLNQVHGTDVVTAPFTGLPNADAVISRTPNSVCCILTADCLPILLSNQQGTEVAAIHAGWRSLAAGVIENTIDAMQSSNASILAFLGPAISQQNFEVGSEVKQAFIDIDKNAEQAFVASSNTGKYMADLKLLAKQRLQTLAVPAENISAIDTCTVDDDKRWYSYRRDGVTGRMLSFIVMK